MKLDNLNLSYRDIEHLVKTEKYSYFKSTTQEEDYLLLEEVLRDLDKGNNLFIFNGLLPLKSLYNIENHRPCKTLKEGVIRWGKTTLNDYLEVYEFVRSFMIIKKL